MIANPTKFQVMLLGLTESQNLLLEINGETTTTYKEVKLRDVTIDSELNFKRHAKAFGASVLFP